MTTATAPAAERNAELKDLHADIARGACSPSGRPTPARARRDQAADGRRAKAVPFLWTYADDIEPILQRAAELVTMDDSERRSLILVNPGLAPKRATVNTMYTAYRLNDPNEIMPPHRHSPSAIRFGLTGNGKLHRRRRREHRLRPGRHGADAERHLAQPRHASATSRRSTSRSSTCRWSRRLNAIHFEHDYSEVRTASA